MKTTAAAAVSAAKDDDDTVSAYNLKPAHMVTLSPIPSTQLNTRRLSSRFSKPTSPVKRTSGSTMAWISLEGRLIGADEATSARAIGGGLSREEAVAWELFSPIHRVLIVAVVAVAAAKCEKNRQIARLRKCVNLRDEILMSMQQKLDDLCEQMNGIKDQPQAVTCWLCDQSGIDLKDLQENAVVKACSGDEMFKNRLSISNEAEQEERRMSDLSDWASSVTSTADIQLNNLAIEQDTYNLKRECEEKDAAIKELSAFIRSKDVATSKRIVELEEVIRRKNTIITKLKKDLIVLEQKVITLTRSRRRSFSGSTSEKKQIPTLTDNVLYDMDSTTSPSSSDSDCSSRKQKTASSVTSEVSVVEAPLNTPVQKNLLTENVTKINQKSVPAKNSVSSRKPSVLYPKCRSVSPLKEKSMNQRHQMSASSSMLNPVSASVGSKSNRRRTHNGSKDGASAKRWM